MSVLGRDDLENALADPEPQNQLIITPLLEKSQIGRGAVDLRLGTDFLVLKRIQRPGLDPSSLHQQEIDNMQERVVVPFGEQLWLHPRHFVLASTLEFLGLPSDMSADVVSRSSWGRLGLIVATAVYVHPGFKGCLTLELVNEGDSPIALSPGYRIAQLVINRLESAAPPRGDVGEKYQAPVRPQASRLPAEHNEFDQLKSLGRRLTSRLG